MRTTVRVLLDPGALLGANAGCDREASLRRYGEALEAALRREWPELRIEVHSDGGIGSGSRIEVEASDRQTEQSLRIQVEALAHAVKHCVDWAVHE